MKKSIHRSLAFGLSTCALLIPSVCALGSPIGEIGATPMPLIQTPQQEQPQQQPAQSKAFSGTIVKQGDEYVLRDSSGTVYKLDNAAQAKEFEGKTVTVTGRLDSQTNTIHVSNIEGAGA
jgi:Protein of unknown function (DUF5818)